MRTVSWLLAAAAAVAVHAQLAVNSLTGLCNSGGSATELSRINANSFFCPDNDQTGAAFDAASASCAVEYPELTFGELQTAFAGATNPQWLAKFVASTNTFVDIFNRPVDSSVVKGILDQTALFNSIDFSADVCFTMSSAGAIAAPNCGDNTPFMCAEAVDCDAAVTVGSGVTAVGTEYHSGVAGCSLPLRMTKEDTSTVAFIGGIGSYDMEVEYSALTATVIEGSTTSLSVILKDSSYEALKKRESSAIATLSNGGGSCTTTASVTVKDIDFLGDPLLVVSFDSGVSTNCNGETLTLTGFSVDPFTYTVGVDDLQSVIDDNGGTVEGYPFNIIAGTRAQGGTVNSFNTLTLSRATGLVKRDPFLTTNIETGSNFQFASGVTFDGNSNNLDGLEVDGVDGLPGVKNLVIETGDKSQVITMPFYIVDANPDTITTSALSLSNAVPSFSETLVDEPVFLGVLNPTEAGRIYGTPDFSTATATVGLTSLDLRVGSTGIAFLYDTVDRETFTSVSVTFDSQIALVTIDDVEEGSVSVTTTTFTAGVDASDDASSVAGEVIVTLIHPSIIINDPSSVPPYTATGAFTALSITPTVTVSAANVATLTYAVPSTTTYADFRQLSGITQGCGEVDMDLSIKFDASNDAPNTGTITATRLDVAFIVDPITDPTGPEDTIKTVTVTITGEEDQLEDGCSAPAMGDFSVTGDVSDLVSSIVPSGLVGGCSGGFCSASYTLTIDAATSRQFWDLVSASGATMESATVTNSEDYVLEGKVTLSDSSLASPQTFTVSQTNVFDANSYTVTAVSSTDSMNERAQKDFSFTINSVDILPGQEGTVPTLSTSGPLHSAASLTVATISSADVTDDSGTSGTASITVQAATDAITFPAVIDQVMPGAYATTVDIDLTLGFTATVTQQDTITVTVTDLAEDATSVSIALANSFSGELTENAGAPTTAVYEVTVDDADFLSNYATATCSDLLGQAGGDSLSQTISSVSDSYLSFSAACVVSSNGQAVITYTLSSNFDYEAVAADAGLTRASAGSAVSVGDLNLNTVASWGTVSSSSSPVVTLGNVQELPSAASIFFDTPFTVPENAGSASAVVLVTISTPEFAFNFPGASQLAGDSTSTPMTTTTTSMTTGTTTSTTTTTSTPSSTSTQSTTPYGSQVTNINPVMVQNQNQNYNPFTNTYQNVNDKRTDVQLTTTDGNSATVTLFVPDYLPLQTLDGTSWQSTDANTITANIMIQEFDLEQIFKDADKPYSAYPSDTDGLSLSLTLVQDGGGITSSSSYTLDLQNVIENEVTISGETPTPDAAGPLIAENSAATNVASFTISVDDVEGDSVLQNTNVDLQNEDETVSTSDPPTAFDVGSFTRASFPPPAAGSPWTATWNMNLQSGGADFEDVLRTELGGVPTEAQVNTALTDGAPITFRAYVDVGEGLGDKVTQRMLLSIRDVDEVFAVEAESFAFSCFERATSGSATNDDTNNIVFTVTDEDYSGEDNSDNRFWSFQPTAYDSLNYPDRVFSGELLDLVTTTHTTMGTKRTYSVDCDDFDFEAVLCQEGVDDYGSDDANRLCRNFDPADTSYDMDVTFAPVLAGPGAPSPAGSFGQLSGSDYRTTATLHDQNESPRATGLLGNGAFEVRENSVPGTPIARLDSMDGDRTLRPDPITRVEVYSLGASIEPYLIDPANWVWGLRVADGAHFNLEDPEESQGTSLDADGRTFTPNVNSRTITPTEDSLPGAPGPANRRAQVAANFFVSRQDHTIGDSAGSPSTDLAFCSNIQRDDDGYSDAADDTVNEIKGAYGVGEEHLQDTDFPFEYDPIVEQVVKERFAVVNGLKYRQVPMCIRLVDCAGPERTLGEGGPATCTATPGVPPAAAKDTLFSAYLYISDRNDAPEFENTNLVPDGEESFTDSFTLPENTPVDTEFGTLSLTDEDGDEVASVTVLSPYTGEFSVIFTGVQWRLQNLKAFDWERPQDNVANSNKFDINLRLTDFKPNGIPASRVVSVTITIENQNEVPFSLVTSTLDVDENTVTSDNIEAIGSVEVEDAEGLGAFTPSGVSFTGVPSGISLAASMVGACSDDPNANTCIDVSLSTMAPGGAFLDYETRTSFAVDMVIVDDGTPSLTSTIPLTVHINDVDEDATLATVTAPSADVPTNSPEDEATGWIFSLSDPEDATVDTAQFTVTSSPAVAAAQYTVRPVMGSPGHFELFVDADTFPDASAGNVDLTVDHPLVGGNPDITVTVNFVNFELHPILDAVPTVSFTEGDVSTTEATVALEDVDGALSVAGYTISVDGATAAASIDVDGLSFTVQTAPSLALVVAPTASAAPGLDIDAGPLGTTQTYDIEIIDGDATAGTAGNSPLTFTLTVDITAVDEPASASFVTSSITVAEDAPAGAVITVVTLTDPEGVVSPAQGVTASVDNPRLSVMWNMGAGQWELQNNGLDFEVAGTETYTVTFTHNSNTLAAAGPDTLTVTDVQEVPVIKAGKVAQALAINVRENSQDALLLSVDDDDIVDPDNADGSDDNVIKAATLMAYGPEDSTAFFTVVFDGVGNDVELRTQGVTPLLDFETETDHEVVIRITTGVDGDASTDEYVDLVAEVQVTDVQKAPFLLDNAGQRATAPVVVQFDENAGINAVAGDLLFEDPDGDAVQSVEIIGPVADLFTIVPSLEGGEEFSILTLFDFDFEDDTPNSWTFAIRINERKPADEFAFSRIATVTLELQDVNEAPFFLSTTQTVSELTAGLITGTSVADWAQATVGASGIVDLGVIEVDDVDDGSTLTLSTTTSNFDFDGDVLQFTGAALAQFDFETGPRTFNVDVTVSDGALSTTETITVSVTDQDDPAALVGPAPFSTPEDTANVPAGITVPNFEFFDQDARVAGDLPMFHLTVTPAAAAPLFTLSQGTFAAGQVELEVAYARANGMMANFEMWNTITLEVSGGGVSHSVVVTLTDVNEAPIPDTTSISLEESTVDIATFTPVHDSADIVFTPVDGSAPFNTIDSVAAAPIGTPFTVSLNGNTVTVEYLGLDVDASVPDMTFNLEVVQDGVTFTYPIDLTVIPVNEVPSFASVDGVPATVPPTNAVLAENSPTGTVVLTFTLTDPESVAPITARRVGSSWLDVRGKAGVPGTWEVYQSSMPLDFETQDGDALLDIEIEVSDDGNALPTFTLQVSLDDVQEAPILTPLSTTVYTLAEANVFDGGLVGEPTQALHVVDPDTTGSEPITLTVTAATDMAGNGDFVHLFNVQSVNTGFWQLYNTALTLEDIAAVPSTFAVTLTATDETQGAPSSDFTIHVSFGTMAPFLTSTTSLNVDENLPIASEVDVMNIVDIDGGLVAFVSVLGEGTGVFRVSNSGGRWRMTTLVELNREAKASYRFPIVLVDNAIPASERTVTVEVEVNNVNELPTGATGTVDVSVVEGTAAWSMPLQSDDVDAGETGVWTVVSITPNTFVANAPDFTVAEDATGAWTLNAAFTPDYEQHSAASTIVLALNDDNSVTGAAPLSTLTVNVQVLNVNEAFTMDAGVEMNPSLDEDAGYGINTAVGTTVTSLSLTDADDFTGYTTTLSASISAAVPFALEATGNNGWDIVTTAGLDFETTTSWTFDVVVTDANSAALPWPAPGNAVRTESYTFTVTVNNVLEPSMTPTPSVTPSSSATTSPSVTAAVTPSRTAVPTPTRTPAATAAVTPSPTPAVSPSVGAVATVSVTPSAAATPSGTPVPGAVTRVGGTLTDIGEVTTLGSETAGTPPTALFAASSIATGNELYSQTFPAAIGLAAELADGTLSSNPRQLTRVPAADAVCFVADSTQFGTEVFCYTAAARVFLAANIHPTAGSTPTILGAVGSNLWVSATGASGTNALFTVTVDATAPDTWSMHAAHSNARLLTTSSAAVYYVATDADGVESLFTTAGDAVSAVVTSGPTALSITTMAAAGSRLVISGEDAAGITSVLVYTPAAGTPAVGSVIILGQARRALKGARSLQSAFRAPRFTTSLGNTVYFAWRSEADASVDALWSVDSTGAATEVSAFPAPRDAAANAVVSATALAAAGGALFAQVSGTVDTTSTTEIFRWSEGAWMALGTVDVSAGRDVGSSPTGLRAVSANAISFNAVLGTDTTPSLVLLDVVRTATAAAVIPSPSATPSASPAAAAQASQPEPATEDNSAALGAGIAIIAILMVAALAFVAWRACGAKKEPEAVPAATAAAPAAAPAVAEAGAPEAAQV